jgi:hypothetical protein
MSDQKRSSKTFIPNSIEIHAACRGIRREWSWHERQFRRLAGSLGWTVLALPCPAYAVQKGSNAYPY